MTVCVIAVLLRDILIKRLMAEMLLKADKTLAYTWLERSSEILYQ